MTDDTHTDDQATAQNDDQATAQNDAHGPAAAPGGPEGPGGAADAAAADGEANPGDDGHEVDPRLRAARKDAAGYRERLREAEGARDAAAARVAGLERAILERVNPMAGHLTAEALVTLGLDIAAFIDDSGAVDTDGLAAECRRIAHAAGVRPAAAPFVAAVGRESDTPARPDDWLRHAMPGSSQAF